ncbi:hypothetical protein J6590_086246 [Homalodisca vitripennis]|nr:hypothetical protein J6590_086246 [Homalodisca vitripennis]
MFVVLYRRHEKQSADLTQQGVQSSTHRRHGWMRGKRLRQELINQKDGAEHDSNLGAAPRRSCVAIPAKIAGGHAQAGFLAH